MKSYFSLFVTMGLLLATKSLFAKECTLSIHSEHPSRLKYLSLVPHMRIKYSLDVQSGVAERDLNAIVDEPSEFSMFDQKVDNILYPIHFIGIVLIWNFGSGVYSEAHESLSRIQRHHGQNMMRIQKHLDSIESDNSAEDLFLISRIEASLKGETLKRLHCELG